MPHTVFVDRGTHWEVIADYSASRRHVGLSATQWQAEYATAPAYLQMRNGNAGSQAGVTPKGCGKWLPDWSGPYKDPIVKLSLSSSASADFDGVPAVQADGTSKHIITILQKDGSGLDVSAGPGPLRVLVSAPVPVSNKNPSLAGGRAKIEIGPSTQAFDLEVTVVDPDGTMEPGEIKVRFQ